MQEIKPELQTYIILQNEVHIYKQHLVSTVARGDAYNIAQALALFRQNHLLEPGYAFMETQASLLSELMHIAVEVKDVDKLKK